MSKKYLLRIFLGDKVNPPLQRATLQDHRRPRIKKPFGKKSRCPASSTRPGGLFYRLTPGREAGCDGAVGIGSWLGGGGGGHSYAAGHHGSSFFCEPFKPHYLFRFPLQTNNHTNTNRQTKNCCQRKIHKQFCTTNGEHYPLPPPNVVGSGQVKPNRPKDQPQGGAGSDKQGGQWLRGGWQRVGSVGTHKA